MIFKFQLIWQVYHLILPKEQLRNTFCRILDSVKLTQYLIRKNELKFFCESLVNFLPSAAVNGECWNYIRNIPRTKEEKKEFWWTCISTLRSLSTGYHMIQHSSKGTSQWKQIYGNDFAKISQSEPVGGSSPKLPSGATEHLSCANLQPTSLLCAAQGAPVPAFRWSRILLQSNQIWDFVQSCWQTFHSDILCLLSKLNLELRQLKGGPSNNPNFFK